MTGAATPIKIVDFRGYDQLITSPTTGIHLGFPIPVCFTDPNGNEYTMSGGTLGNFTRAPFPVVLCNQQGQPIVPPVAFTSNGNTMTVTATLSGNKLGTPTPVMLCDSNGFLYILY